MLSLKGDWLKGHVMRRGCWISFEPESFIVPGMSGWPIVSPEGKAIGIVSVTQRSPVLVDTLSSGLLRSIHECQEATCRAGTQEEEGSFNAGGDRTF